MRILRFLYIAFVSVVALVVGIYLLVNIGGVLAAEVKRGGLEDQITERIAEVLPTAQQFVGPVADRVGVAPTHSWTAQHCDFRTNDSGWIAIDYREVCTLESVHAWQVDTEEDARALLGGQVPTTEPFVLDACHHYQQSDAPYAEGVSFLYIEPSTAEDRWCAPTHRDHSQRRPVTGDPLELDSSRGWLVVLEEIELVDEVIGCAHWTVVFCTNPFGDELAWGEPPA